MNPEAARLQMAESRIMDMESQIETGAQMGKQHASKNRTSSFLKLAFFKMTR